MVMIMGMKEDLFDFLWYFSLYLESITIIPQLMLLRRSRDIENLTQEYIFFMGLYRGLYIFNWIYRSYHDKRYHHNYVVYFTGVLQTALYIDFFYYYFRAKLRGEKLRLPA